MLERSTSMNFYNPYMFYPTSMTAPATTGLLGSSIGRGFSFSSLLNGAQKTLTFVNQAIPVVKQVSPLMKNAKTMFRVMNEFKKVDTPSAKENKTNIINNKEPISNPVSNASSSNNGPTFFV